VTGIKETQTEYNPAYYCYTWRKTCTDGVRGHGPSRRSGIISLTFVPRYVAGIALGFSSLSQLWSISDIITLYKTFKKYIIEVSLSWLTRRVSLILPLGHLPLATSNLPLQLNFDVVGEILSRISHKNGTKQGEDTKRNRRKPSNAKGISVTESRRRDSIGKCRFGNGRNGRRFARYPGMVSVRFATTAGDAELPATSATRSATP
jgi:hypothetical protein